MVAADPVPGPPDAAELAGIRALLAASPLVDGHNDLLWELRQQVGYDFNQLDIATPCPSLQTDIPRLRAGVVGAQFWSVWVPSDLSPLAALVGTLEQLDAMHQMIARYPRDLELARTADDVTRIAASGRIASLAGMEGGHSIGDSLGALRMMRALGAAYLTLTHNDNTTWADAAMDEPEHDGLTAFGISVVFELNRLGMLVDLSHVAASTMADALAATSAPVIFSHSSARALCDHPRNVPDHILSQLPANGGVCMATFVPGFIDQRIADIWLAGDAHDRELRQQFPDAPEQVARRSAAWRAAHPAPVATVERVADHIDHIRDVAGIQSVGIGSDFDGCPDQPVGLADVSGYPELFARLRRRGYSDRELRMIAGGNVLRVMRVAAEVAQGFPAHGS